MSKLGEDIAKTRKELAKLKKSSKGKPLIVATTPYANNAAAISGGLAVGDGYATAAGAVFRVVAP